MSGGIERQFGGFVLSARYMDRRLLRIIEDSSGRVSGRRLSGNVCRRICCRQPERKDRLFVNEQEIPYTFNANAPNFGAPANCVTNYNTATVAPPS